MRSKGFRLLDQPPELRVLRYEHTFADGSPEETDSLRIKITCHVPR